MAGDKQPESKRSASSALTRRKMVAAMTAASAGLAGCGGGNTGGGNTTTTSGGTGGTDGTGGNTSGGTPTASPTATETATPVDETGEPVTTELHEAFPAWQPSKTNFNSYAPADNAPPFSSYLWHEFTLYTNNKGQICYFTIDDVEFKNGGREILYKFNENYSWWDGTDLTAEDYLMQRKIMQYQQFGSPEKANVDLELVDKYTVRAKRETPINPTVKLQSHVQDLHTKRTYHRKWLEKYKDAGGKKAVEKVTTDLTKHKVNFQEFVDKGLGCAMWKPVKWNPQRVTYEKFDQHPRSDWTNLEKWVWELVSGDQKFDQAFKNGRFQFGELNFKLLESNPNIENVAKFGLPGVPKLSLSRRNKHLRRTGVRHAIAYLIDHDELRRILKANYGTPYKDHPYINGMSTPVAKNWMGEEFLQNKMINYGSSAKPKKARQAMKRAGYSKDGKYWVGPDGDPVKGLEYITPPWSIYQSINKYLAPLLTDFGLGTKQIQPSRSNFYKRLNQTHDFDMVNWYHYAFHPANAYSNALSGLDTWTEIVKTTDSGNVKLTSKRTPRLKLKLRQTIPQMGSMEMSGDGVEITPVEWNKTMRTTQDREKIVSLAKKLAWYYNYTLPHIGFYEEVWNYWADTRKFNFRGNHPDTETDRTRREHTIPNEEAIQTTQGHVSAKTK